MQANPFFESATHLVAHLLREIESALRDALARAMSRRDDSVVGVGGEGYHQAVPCLEANATLARYARTLKDAELNQYVTEGEARAAVFEWIEIFYVRPVQPKLAYLSQGMAGKETILDNS